MEFLIFSFSSGIVTTLSWPLSLQTLTTYSAKL